MDEVQLFLVAGVLGVTVAGYWWVEARRHQRALDALPLRIHVNGIRGKSTVTRLIAGALRQAGVTTVAKTTGSAAALIGPDGVDRPVRRFGPPSILEQLGVVRKAADEGAQALVVECMALDPKNQTVTEDRMVRASIGVLTNVREDHQDVMGETLEEIAASLLSTCPRDAWLVTAEPDPGLQRLMERAASERGSEMIVADPDEVTDEELARFPYVAFKDNVALGLKVSALVGIDRATAMEGMLRAQPDPGVLRLRTLPIADHRVTWANLFAVNDRESTLENVRLLVRRHATAETTVIGMLNNRRDRELRALQFADIASLELPLHRIVLLGAYGGRVRARLVENGYPPECILELGQHQDGERMLETIVGQAPTWHVLLIGMVNIHTEQAERLLEVLEARD